MTDTIFALATGVGRAAVAVIRVSGPRTEAVLRAVAGRVPPARLATLRPLRDPAGLVLDLALVLWFPGPASFTGEDAAELHLHGGGAVIRAVLAVLGDQPGCRPAFPGEFTRRAFLNRKMDLGAVEGLADLIDAETEAQRRQALRLLDGALGAWVSVQRGRLLGALASAEAAIDFSDEADVSGDFVREVRRHAGDLLQAIREQLQEAGTAAQIRSGLVVALTGPPNVGKSTLLNALARRDVAIVSPVAGTTRDPVEVALDLGGYKVTVVDTAGLRDSDDAIEQEGVARARARAATADLVLWLSDLRHPIPPDGTLARNTVWRVGTKLDLVGPADKGEYDHVLAAREGHGVAALLDAIRQVVATGGATDAALMTTERHRAALARAEAALVKVVTGTASELEIAAEQLRTVAHELDSLVGTIATDDVLDAVFARFCIGK